MIKNFTEIAVDEIFGELIKEQMKKNTGLCACELCQDDMRALALNNLPPHYVVTDKGTILTQVSFDLIGGKTQVISVVMNAIKTVGANPRHC